MSPADLAIAIVNWNAGPLLARCLASLGSAGERLALDVTVVDNASSEGNLTGLREHFPFVRFIQNTENIGFARANNQALIGTQAQYVLLLNPDTELRPGALETMLDFMDRHPEAGALGPRLLNADGSLQVSCAYFPTLGSMIAESLGLSHAFPQSPLFARFKMSHWAHDAEREVDQPSGACLLIRRAAWDQLGALDERFFMYFEEVDLCFRLRRAGWRIFFTPRAEVMHHGGQSSLKAPDVRVVGRYQSLLRFFHKHYPVWQLVALRALLTFEMAWRAACGWLRAQRRGRSTARPYYAQYARVAVACLLGDF